MDVKNVTGRQVRKTERSKSRCKNDVEMDLRYMGLKKMENRSFGQSKMCICREGGQGRIKRALVLKEEKEEEGRRMGRRSGRRRVEWEKGKRRRQMRSGRRRGEEWEEGEEKKTKKKKKKKSYHWYTTFM